MKKKTLFIPSGKLGETRLPGKWGGELTPSVDGKGWDYAETEPPPSHQARVEAKFLGGKAAEGTSKTFAEAAKSAGLSPEDAVKLTKLFRRE